MSASVATPEFVESGRYLRLYELARDNGVQEFRIIEPMPCGRLGADSENVLLSPEHIRVLRDFHIMTNRQGRRPKVCAFNQVESPENFGCGGGTQHLYIDSAGAVCPCDFTPLSFGNVLDEPIETIWARMSGTMGAPRRECFIQKHHRLLDPYRDQTLPLSPEISEEIIDQAGTEDLPDYFQCVVSGGGRTDGVTPSKSQRA